MTVKGRAAFIIGAIMGVGSPEGSKVLGISEAAFRKRLSRARKDLSEYMNGRCGLVNPDNRCRCPHKSESAHNAGYIAGERAVFTHKRIKNVEQFMQSFDGNIGDSMMDKVSQIYREVPLMEMVVPI